MTKPDKPHPHNPMDLTQMQSLKHWGDRLSNIQTDTMQHNAISQCGWGRLLFGQTFDNPQDLAKCLMQETDGRRDVALYVRDPHVVISYYPLHLFMDPSLTFRLDFHDPGHDADYTSKPDLAVGVHVRPVAPETDHYAIERIYKSRNMVPVGDTFYADLDNHPEVVMLVAEDTNTGDVLGVVTGVDHRLAFQDPDNGCSLWALAVDPQSHRPAVGMMLVQSLSYHFSQKGRRFMDLSVMHDNTYAISMYKKMGFRQVPVYCIKKKNSINEQLYIGPDLEDDLNVYAKIIIDEARRRGIGVNIQDAAEGFFELSHGGRTIACRESLSELTNAVSMSKCDNKLVTQRILTQHGLCVPAQHVYTSALELDSFLNTYPRVVVKPARGEQGKGISVDVSGKEEVLTAITAAQKHCETVIIEEFVSGDDLRVIVIDREVVAAAVRRAPRIIGTGQHSIENLIRHQSRRRMTATQGESQIPMDIETERCVRAHGYAMHDILPENETIIVRKTANLHTGGTIHDVTKDLHPELIAAAIAAADALSIPVVGLDFMTPDCSKPDYVIIEANERPGLANHEPQPTVERFIDLLFPQTRKLDEIPKG